jgi:hypothetical protein
MTEFECYKCQGELTTKRDPVGHIDFYCKNCKVFIPMEWLDNPYTNEFGYKLLRGADVEFLLDLAEEHCLRTYGMGKKHNHETTIQWAKGRYQRVKEIKKKVQK